MVLWSVPSPGWRVDGCPRAYRGRRRWWLLACALGLSLLTSTAAAVALLPRHDGLAITANLAYRADLSDPPVQATQTGAASLRSGGVLTSIDDLAAFPLQGALSLPGDGLAISTAVEGQGDLALAGLVLEAVITLENSSADLLFDVWLGLGYLQAVSAVGIDAFSISRMTLQDGAGANLQPVSRLIADSIFGPSDDEFALFFDLVVRLPPGSAYILTGQVDSGGEIGLFQPGGADDRFTASSALELELIRIDAYPVATPGSALLLLAGLLAARWTRRAAGQSASRRVRNIASP